MELEILSIKNKGDHTQESVTLRALTRCQIGHYVLFDSTYTREGKVSNEVRHTYWFPDKVVAAGDFLVLHIAPGRTDPHPNQANTITHHFHWGISRPVWNDDQDFATLLHVADWKSMKVG